MQVPLSAHTRTTWWRKLTPRLCIVLTVEEGFDRARDPFGNRLEILDIAAGHQQLVYSADEVFEAPNWTRDRYIYFNSVRSGGSQIGRMEPNGRLISTAARAR